MSNIPPNTHARIDVLQMLRDAQGEAADVAKAQAHLKGMLDEAEALGIFDQNPALARLKSAIDEIRQVADEAAAIAHLLPQPYGLIVQQTTHWIDVADDAFKAVKP